VTTHAVILSLPRWVVILLGIALALAIVRLAILILRA
jgi:hypothetical protein